MILGFKDKRTAAFADGEFTLAFQGFERQGWKRLEILDAATSLDDLRGLPSSVSASTINGGSVSNGPPGRLGHRTSKSSTIPEAGP
jgi:hypothetical protein